MLARAKAPDQGGARIAIIMNGSPLFTGDAGSGESEIRRFILENDLLEALIALPEQPLLQHRHRHLRVAPDQPQGAEAPGHGATHRRHRVLVADAPESRRQAA